MATIKEDDNGNQLRFESITSLDDLTASIENNYLVFKDKESPPRTLLIDHEWGNKLNTGISTNLFDLIIDFAQRFPLILFRKNKKEFNRLTSKDTIKFLYKYLKDHETALGQDFDTILDSISLPSDVGVEIDVGNGQNIVLAKTRGKTYKLGSKSSGSIIVANKFTQGTGKVTIKGGDDRNSLNAVVVGVESGGVVDIRMGPHDVVITGAHLSEVQVSQDSNYMVHLKDSKQRDLIAGWYYNNCKNLIFKKSTTSTNENTQIIFNCNEYISQKLYSSRQNNPITVSYDSDRLLRLNCPFTKDDAIINLYYNYKDALRIFLTGRNSGGTKGAFT